MTDKQLLDDGLLKPLLEQSQDIHSDAMAAVQEPMGELVDRGLEARAHGSVETVDLSQARANRWDGMSKVVAGAGGLVAATGIGAALMSIFAGPAAASTTDLDTMILQTAASIEVLAINTYAKALTLPYIGGSSANKVVTAFAKTTMAQHKDHHAAFNAALTQLGGATQNSPDPHYISTVNSAVASLSGMSDSAATLAVVNLASLLENIAAETYTNDMYQLTDSNSKTVMASIMGVEAQHVAVLNAVAVLLKANLASVIALPTTVSAIVANDNKIPSNTPQAAFGTSAFYGISSAAPASQGAVS